MMPGSVQEVRLRKRVVVATERKRRMGRAGVTLVHTSATTKMQYMMRTISVQMYQHALGPQSFLVDAVMQQPQKKLLFPGHNEYSFAISVYNTPNLI